MAVEEEEILEAAAAPEAVAALEVAAAAALEIWALERCTMQPAQNADSNVKFLSSQGKTGQFIAETASQKERGSNFFC